MFCKNCGFQIDDSDKFCPSCGTATQSVPPQPAATPLQKEPVTPASVPTPPPEPFQQIHQTVSQPQWHNSQQNLMSYTQTFSAPKPAQSVTFEEVKRAFATQPRENGATDTDFDAAANNVANVVQNEQQYYLPQFRAMRAGTPSKFNWASFFLSGYHAFYRNMWREWLGFFRIPLTILAITSVATLLFSIMQLWTLLSLTSIAYFVGSIWNIVNGVRFASKFNLLYMYHVDDVLQGRLPQVYGTSVARAFILVGICVGAIILLQIVGAATMMPWLS